MTVLLMIQPQFFIRADNHRFCVHIPVYGIKQMNYPLKFPAGKTFTLRLDTT